VGSSHTQIPAGNAACGVEGDLVTAMRKPLLELLVSLLDSGTIYEEMDEDIAEEPETPRSLVAEGFAKLLLQSRLFKDIQAIEDAILAKLLRLYFNDDLEISPRLVEVSVKCTIMCFARTRLTTHVLCRLNHLFTSNTIYRIIYL
jgi:hypothetical protein